MTNQQMESEIENLKEKFELLKGAVDALIICAKKESTAQLEAQEEVQREKPKKFIQINANKKTYLCKTEHEKQIFTENNPGVEAEVRECELTAEQAAPYLADQDNKFQFTARPTEGEPK
jgi:hypothetical protein